MSTHGDHITRQKQTSIFHLNLLSIVVTMAERTVAMEGQNTLADDGAR